MFVTLLCHYMFASNNVPFAYQMLRKTDHSHSKHALPSKGPVKQIFLA